MALMKAAVQDFTTLKVGTPDELKKPRKTKHEEPLSREEWRAFYEERLARYLPVDVTGKIDVLVHDIKEIMSEAEEHGSERPVKLIIYSNFAEAFTRIKLMLDTEGLRYTCAFLLSSGVLGHLSFISPSSLL